ALDFGDRVFVARSAESQGERSEGKLEQPAAFLARYVVLAFWGGLGDQLNLPFVEAQADIELLEDFIARVDVGQEDFGGRALGDHIQDSAAAGIRERLGGHYDGTVSFAHDFEPFPDFVPESRVPQHQPSLVQNDHAGLTSLRGNQTLDSAEKVQ